MIKHEDEMNMTVRTRMRGGDGEIKVKEIVTSQEIKHSRMFSELTIEPGCSIGFHEHMKETEYYYILEGCGIVTEKDGDKKVCKGDVVITGDGESHAIRNSGNKTLRMIALIILD